MCFQSVPVEVVWVASHLGKTWIVCKWREKIPYIVTVCKTTSERLSPLRHLYMLPVVVFGQLYRGVRVCGPVFAMWSCVCYVVHRADMWGCVVQTTSYPGPDSQWLFCRQQEVSDQTKKRSVLLLPSIHKTPICILGN